MFFQLAYMGGRSGCDNREQAGSAGTIGGSAGGVQELPEVSVEVNEVLKKHILRMSLEKKK